MSACLWPIKFVADCRHIGGAQTDSTPFRMRRFCALLQRGQNLAFPRKSAILARWWTCSLTGQRFWGVSRPVDDGGVETGWLTGPWGL